MDTPIAKPTIRFFKDFHLTKMTNSIDLSDLPSGYTIVKLVVTPTPEIGKVGYSLSGNKLILNKRYPKGTIVQIFYTIP